MVKLIAAFSGNLFKTGYYRAHAAFLEKLTESLERSTVRSEQEILPYSPDLLKLSQHLWSSPT
jgi:hypothetical protein